MEDKKLKFDDEDDAEFYKSVVFRILVLPGDLTADAVATSAETLFRAYKELKDD